MTRLVVGLFVPLLALALAVPLILEKVPPNNTYGFRTSRTLSAPEIWYPANRMAGWFMAGGGPLALFQPDALVGLSGMASRAGHTMDGGRNPRPTFDSRHRILPLPPRALTACDETRTTRH